MFERLNHTLTTKTVGAFALACALSGTLLVGCGGAGSSGSTSSAGPTPSPESVTDVKTESPADVEVTQGTAPTQTALSLASLSATTIDGREFTGADFAKADVTLVNCWSIYCGYCVEELPDIAAWAKKLPDNVQVITVNLDGDYDLADAKEILDEAGFEGTTLVSGNAAFQKLANEVIYLPTTFVLDSEGKLIDEPFEGAPRDVASAYTELVNDALVGMGKEAINV